MYCMITRASARSLSDKLQTIYAIASTIRGDPSHLKPDNVDSGNDLAPNNDKPLPATLMTQLLTSVMPHRGTRN